jgi:hypothetical protein
MCFINLTTVAKRVSNTLPVPVSKPQPSTVGLGFVNLNGAAQQGL